MTNQEFTSASGLKKVIVRKGTDGYGDTIFRVRFIEVVPCGTHNQERLIEMKSYSTEKRALNWAKKQVA